MFLQREETLFFCLIIILLENICHETQVQAVLHNHPPLLILAACFPQQPASDAVRVFPVLHVVNHCRKKEIHKTHKNKFSYASYLSDPSLQKGVEM